MLFQTQIILMFLKWTLQAKQVLMMSEILIEFSRYGPTTAKYKIFIIDEVHMLSKQAFNALLKTR